MKLSETDLNKAERAWLENALDAKEEILWSGRPEPTLLKEEVAVMAVFSLIWLGIVGGMAFSAVREGNLIVLFFLVPFVLAGAGLLCMPWRKKRELRHTAYILTSSRALVLKPEGLLKHGISMLEFRLRPGMLMKVETRQDGSGDIIMGYDGHNGAAEDAVRRPQGFMRIPEAQQVRKLILERLEGACAEASPSLPLDRSGGNMKTGKVAGVFIMLFGLLFAGVGAWLLNGNLNYARNGLRAEGVVERLAWSHDSDSDSCYPVIAFKDEKGSAHSVRSSYGSNPPAYKVGEKVKVLYLPEKPDEIRIEAPFSLYVFPLLFLIPGLLVFSLGVLMFCKGSGKKGLTEK